MTKDFAQLFVNLHRTLALVSVIPGGFRLTECINGFPVGDQTDVSERDGVRRCECVTWERWRECEHVEALKIVGRRLV